MYNTGARIASSLRVTMPISGFGTLRGCLTLQRKDPWRRTVCKPFDIIPGKCWLSLSIAGTNQNYHLQGGLCHIPFIVVHTHSHSMPKVFITCGGDCTVRLFDSRRPYVDGYANEGGQEYIPQAIGGGPANRYFDDVKYKDSLLVNYGLGGHNMVENQSVFSVDFHPTNSYVFAASSSDGFTRIFDLRRTTLSPTSHVHIFRNAQLKYPDNHEATCAKFSHDGSELVVTNMNDQVYLYDVPTFSSYRSPNITKTTIGEQPECLNSLTIDGKPLMSAAIEQYSTSTIRCPQSRRRPPTASSASATSLVSASQNNFSSSENSHSTSTASSAITSNKKRSTIDGTTSAVSADAFQIVDQTTTGQLSHVPSTASLFAAEPFMFNFNTSADPSTTCAISSDSSTPSLQSALSIHPFRFQFELDESNNTSDEQVVHESKTASTSTQEPRAKRLKGTDYNGSSSSSSGESRTPVAKLARDENNEPGSQQLDERVDNSIKKPKKLKPESSSDGEVDLSSEYMFSRSFWAKEEKSEEKTEGVPPTDEREAVEKLSEEIKKGKQPSKVKKRARVDDADREEKKTDYYNPMGRLFRQKRQRRQNAAEEDGEDQSSSYASDEEPYSTVSEEDESSSDNWSEDDDDWFYDRRRPVLYKQSYFGHIHCKTLKNVSFFGSQSEYVMSGSDDGHIYIWCRQTGALVRVLLPPEKEKIVRNPRNRDSTADNDDVENTLESDASDESASSGILTPTIVQDNVDRRMETLIMQFEADRFRINEDLIVNTVIAHPFLPIIASAGLASSISLWSPTAGGNLDAKRKEKRARYQTSLVRANMIRFRGDYF